MQAFAVTRICKVRPRRQGSRQEVPAGFRTDHTYQVLSGFAPNGTSDLHFVVVNESGTAVTLLADDVLLLDPGRPGYDDGISNRVGVVQRVAKVKPRRGQMPPGFRPERVYEVLAGVVPNGTSDHHFVVVNESGLAVLLLGDDIILLDPTEPGYPGSTAAISGLIGGLPVTFVFAASRTWVATYGLGVVVGIDAIDPSHQRIVPHRVTFDSGFNAVTVDWTYPVAGTLILS